MWNQVTVIGVGLIGGSIGLALRRRELARQVVGVGRTPQRLAIAHEMGAVSSFTTDLAEGVAEADLVVVCTPVATIADTVRRVGRCCPAGALITDAGSTKGEICRAVSAAWDDRARFVGSHPMAGSEKSGPEFSEANLFEGSVTIVTPGEGASEQAVQSVEQFWRSLGSQTVRMSPDEHDRAVAAISHVPHLVASALAAATAAEDLPLAGGGWRDTTRVASGDVQLWRQILTENRPHILQSLVSFEKVLCEFRQALQENDAEAITRLLDAGKQNRDALGS
jgi:prephenate dehydrogenase